MKRRRIPYSDAEMAWLEANRAMIISDYHRAFVVAFGRAEVSAQHLHSLRKRKGWKVGRAAGRYRGRSRLFSPAEIAWLRDNCTMQRADYHAEFSSTFGRTDVTPAQLLVLHKRSGWRTGRTGHFEKGQAPANKGKPCAPGTGGRHPNARKTQFKPGELPHTYLGPGHERIDSKDGYVILVVAETNPWSGAATRPVHKHRWLWEQANGPIPEGHALKCLDGNKLNTDPSNWEPVPRALLPRLNGRFGRGYDQAPAEMKPMIMAVAKLEHQVRNIRRNGGR